MTDFSAAPTSFFLATADGDVSKTFYAEVLGLELIEDSQFAVVFKLAGAELRISKVPSLTPFPWTVLDWQVDDLAQAMRQLKDKGVTFERFDGMEQDEDGVWAVPGGGVRIAWFKDPDRNVLSVSQRG